MACQGMGWQASVGSQPVLSWRAGISARQDRGWWLAYWPTRTGAGGSVSALLPVWAGIEA